MKSENIFCPKCGSKQQGNTFCSKCGNQLIVEEQKKDSDVNKSLIKEKTETYDTRRPIKEQKTKKSPSSKSKAKSRFNVIPNLILGFFCFWFTLVLFFPLSFLLKVLPIILMFILSRYFKLLFEFFYFSISGALFYGFFFSTGTNELNYSLIYEATFAYFFICIAYVIIFFISEKQKPNNVKKSVKSPMKEIITKAQDNYEHNLNEEKQQP